MNTEFRTLYGDLLETMNNEVTAIKAFTLIDLVDVNNESYIELVNMMTKLNSVLLKMKAL